MRKEELTRYVDVINSGGVILYPTDTIWGLGGDSTNAEVIQRIYNIKKRPDSKSLVTLVSDLQMLKDITDVGPEAEDIILSSNRPTTVIYNQVSVIHKAARAEDGSAAIRIVNDEFCQALIRAMGKPLLSTSANISGQPSPMSFADISDEIKRNVDVIATHRRDEISDGSASRILKLNGNEVEVIRH